MEEKVPDFPRDPDEKMVKGGADISGPPPKRILVIRRSQKTVISAPKVGNPQETHVITINHK